MDRMALPSLQGEGLGVGSLTFIRDAFGVQQIEQPMSETKTPICRTMADRHKARPYGEPTSCKKAPAREKNKLFIHILNII